MWVLGCGVWGTLRRDDAWAKAAAEAGLEGGEGAEDQGDGDLDSSGLSLLLPSLPPPPPLALPGVVVTTAAAAEAAAAAVGGGAAHGAVASAEALTGCCDCSGAQRLVAAADAAALAAAAEKELMRRMHAVCAARSGRRTAKPPCRQERRDCSSAGRGGALSLIHTRRCRRMESVRSRMLPFPSQKKHHHPRSND